jgi:putative chitinase
VFGRTPSAEQLQDLNACLDRFSINTTQRIRHFLAQVGHESGGLRWMLELATGDAYEGRQDLGNTQPGDGRRFKGAGAIQLTGRYNYQRFADYIKDQQVMEGCKYVSTVYPFTSAGYWWHLNSMNVLVDQGATCRQISARVNGRDPANGLADREDYFSLAIEYIQ